MKKLINTLRDRIVAYQIVVVILTVLLVIAVFAGYAQYQQAAEEELHRYVNDCHDRAGTPVLDLIGHRVCIEPAKTVDKSNIWLDDGHITCLNCVR